MIRHLLQRTIRWIDRFVDADERVVCAVCDDRFADVADGLAHLRLAHPHMLAEVTTMAAHPRAQASRPVAAYATSPSAEWTRRQRPLARTAV